MEKQHAEFVDCHRSKLIQRVTVVMAIADALRAVKIIHEETYSNILAASTNMDKMRMLLGALNTNKAKSAFYNLLKVNEPFLFEDLKPEEIEQGMEGASAHTSSEVLETESQGTEDQQITWWNRDRSHTRHKTKIEELLKETDKQKVGNLWFYKVEKYMIGSGGSGTQVYIAVCEDGIEVAIKIITKNPKNIKDFENELKLLQDSKLESPYIVRYVTCTEDKDFYYLANQLCEYDLVDYMEYLRQPEQKDRKETTLRRLVEEMLLGLQVLHCAEVIHRATARTLFLNFGLFILPFILSCQSARFLVLLCCLKKEVLKELGDQPEVQHYIDILKVCETKKAEEALTARKAVEKTFINTKDKHRRTAILKMLGETESQEVQNQKLEDLSKVCNSAEKLTQGKSFSKWKSELSDINNAFPEDILGLLRTYRNKLIHGGFDEQMLNRFPDLYISLHRLAIDVGWDCIWS